MDAVAKHAQITELVQQLKSGRLTKEELFMRLQELQKSGPAPSAAFAGEAGDGAVGPTEMMTAPAVGSAAPVPVTHAAAPPPPAPSRGRVHPSDSRPSTASSRPIDARQQGGPTFQPRITPLPASYGPTAQQVLSSIPFQGESASVFNDVDLAARSFLWERMGTGDSGCLEFAVGLSSLQNEPVRGRGTRRRSKRG
jgi:hypothetical protein